MMYSHLGARALSIPLSRLILCIIICCWSAVIESASIELTSPQPYSLLVTDPTGIVNVQAKATIVTGEQNEETLRLSKIHLFLNRQKINELEQHHFKMSGNLQPGKYVIQAKLVSEDGVVHAETPEVWFRVDHDSGKQQGQDTDQPLNLVGIMYMRNEGKRGVWAACDLATKVNKVIVLDHYSTDNSLAMLLDAQERCNLDIIQFEGSKELDERSIRQTLVDRATRIGATHVISVDADEVLSYEGLDGRARFMDSLLDLVPGQGLYLFWMYLWKSVNWLRTDKLYNDEGGFQHHVLSVARLPLQGTAQMMQGYIHIHRVPVNPQIGATVCNHMDVGLAHLQFVHWKNKLLKDAWYRAFERTQEPNKSSQAIVDRYSGTVDESGIRCGRVNLTAMFNLTEEFKDLWMRQPVLDMWRVDDIRAMVQKHGSDKFKGLNVFETLDDLGLLQAVEPSLTVPPQMTSFSQERLPILSILYTTKHPGSYDIIISSLALQTSKAFELVCVDEMAEDRLQEVLDLAASMKVHIQVVAPGKPRAMQQSFKLYSAYNTGLLLSRGAVITMLNDFAALGKTFVEDTLRFYLHNTGNVGLNWNSRHYKSLLGYSDIFYTPPKNELDPSGLQGSSVSVFRNALFKALPSSRKWPKQTEISPPESMNNSFVEHWAWDGAAMSGPFHAFSALNGFDEFMDSGDDNQMENIRDRLMLWGWNVWIAPREALVQQVHHYNWQPESLWSRPKEDSNLKRWKARLKDTRNGNVPIVTPTSTHLLKLSNGTIHSIPKEVQNHMDEWRQHTENARLAAAAKIGIESCAAKCKMTSQSQATVQIGLSQSCQKAQQRTLLLFAGNQCVGVLDGDSAASPASGEIHEFSWQDAKELHEIPLELEGIGDSVTISIVASKSEGCQGHCNVEHGGDICAAPDSTLLLEAELAGILCSADCGN